MKYLQNKNIIITGGGGFLGQHIIHHLLKNGIDKDRIFVPRMKDFDLTIEENVSKLYKQFPADIVIHLAAEVGGIGANRDNPGRFFYSNMAMGLHLIEHARINNIQKFIQVGTACAYPKFTSVPFKEEDLWEGHPEETNAPYGIAKRALITMLQAYRQQYGLNGICLIPVNLYGPGDRFDSMYGHVIPTIIKKCFDAIETKQDFIECWGSGNATREFLYVKDAAEGILLAAEQYNGPMPINLGNGIEIPIWKLAEKIMQLTKFAGRVKWNTAFPDGQMRRCLDISKAYKYFNFAASTNFDEGLKETIEWYRVNRQ